MRSSPASRDAIGCFSPHARRDVLEAIRWIDKDSRTAARGFREAVVNAARRIGEYPLMAPVRPEIAEEYIRFLVLSGYPYVVVYNSKRRPALILRVLHGARDIPSVLRQSGF